MTDKPDNPPAFPYTQEWSPLGGGLGVTYREVTGGGMSVRDYFAAHAPITIDHAKEVLRAKGLEEVSHAEIFKYLAQMRYAYADAMLRERVK